MDAITIELIQKVQQLPLEKQKAVLQIVNVDFSSTSETQSYSREEWRKQLLECSVWSEEQIHDITELKRQERLAVWLSLPAWSEEDIQRIEAIHNEINHYEPRTV
jgi:hypothetical protein